MKGKATKKPVTIDYFIWNNNPEDLGDWVFSFDQDPTDHFDFEGGLQVRCQVKTLDGGVCTLPIGWIILRGVKGEFYPCEPKIFRETYDY